MPVKATPKSAEWLPALIIAAIGAAYALMEMQMADIGDDAGYRASWFTFSGLEGYVRWCLGHWVGANGRLPNFVMPPMLALLPRWLMSALDGVAVAASFALTLKLCRLGKNRVTASMLLISIIAFSFPWWDSTLLNCVMLNYVWAEAIGLWFLWRWLCVSDSTRWRWGLYLLSFVAGMMHEAFSLPLVCGLAAYFIMSHRWKELGVVRRNMFWWFAVGTVLCAFSLSIILRLIDVNTGGTPDDPMWLLVLKSDAWALLLLLLIAAAFFADRKRLFEMAKSTWVIFAVAALASMCISAVGGIVGRSGWFACAFALIAIFRWGAAIRLRLDRRAGVALSALMAVMLLIHYAFLVAWQVRLGKELRESIRLYAHSADGVIYFDYTPDSELPWWLLHKNRGVPDSDDFYLLETIAKTYGTSDMPMVILPTAAKDIDLHTIDGEIAVGDGYITDRMPAVDSRGLFIRHGRMFVSQPIPIHVTTPGDSLTAPQTIKKLYYLTPRDQDPGDR